MREGLVHDLSVNLLDSDFLEVWHLWGGVLLHRRRPWGRGWSIGPQCQFGGEGLSLAP